MRKDKDALRGVKTVPWDDAIRTIQDTEYVLYRPSAWDEYDIVPTVTMMSTLAELKCEVDIFLGKGGQYHIARPMARQRG